MQLLRTYFTLNTTSLGASLIMSSSLSAATCYTGQGVNQALEDAVVLAQSIRDGGLTASSLRAYESARIPRLQEIGAFQIVSLPNVASVCMSPPLKKLTHFESTVWL